MNTKTFSTYLFPSYIMLGIIFLTACSPLGGAPVVLAQPDTLPEIPVTGFGADVAELSSVSSSSVTEVEEDNLRTWEINAGDIEAAREAAETLSQIYTVIEVDFEEEDVLRTWEIDINDIAAAREAVQILSQVNAVDEVDFDAIDLITGELNASDISAARQAAHFLKTAEHVSDEINADDISAARQAANYLAAAAQIDGEMDASDISAAHVAAEYLSQIYGKPGVNLKNMTLPRTAAEFSMASRYGASEELLAERFGVGQ